MIVGVGIDVLEKERLIRGLDAAFEKRGYTGAEIAQGHQHPVPTDFFAARFSAKEAVFKALSCCGAEFEPREIEILSDSRGRPTAAVYGKTKALLEEYLGGAPYSIHLSISLESHIVTAIAAIETAEERSQI